MRIRTMSLAAALAASALMLTACGGGDDPLDTGDTKSTPSSGEIVVGSANFPESQLLAEIYAGALEAKGVKVTKRLNIGSREVYLPALLDGSIDLLPEYNGALLSYLQQGEVTVTSPDQVYDALVKVLPDGIVSLEQSAAEDKDAVAVTKATADKYELATIADLEPVAGDLTIGGPPENRDRRAGMVGLKDVYGLTFNEFKPLDTAGPLTVKALADGTIDAAFLFTTQGAIAENGFVVLDDPEQLFLAENVLPVANEKKVTDTVRAALNAVSAKLTTENLTNMVKEVEVDKREAAAVAKDFLEAQGLS